MAMVGLSLSVQAAYIMQYPSAYLWSIWMRRISKVSTSETNSRSMNNHRNPICLIRGYHVGQVATFEKHRCPHASTF
jgi:hypothetical protein